MVKQKLEEYGSQPFHLGDAFIGAGAVLFGVMIVIFFNYDPETSKTTLAHKIEMLEGQVERLSQEDYEHVRSHVLLAQTDRSCPPCERAHVRPWRLGLCGGEREL